MSSRIVRISAAAAMLLLNGAVAFAQSKLELKVPFTFRTPTATMAPGHYVFETVSRGQPVPVYLLQNLDNGQRVLMATTMKSMRKESQRSAAEVVFKCAGEYCALSAIYRPGESYGDSVPLRLKRLSPHYEIAEIRIPASE